MIAPGTLKDLAFFAGLSQVQLNSLSIIADEVSFQQGDRIFEEDQPAHTLYLLLDGWVDILINTDGRGNHRESVTTRTAGDVLGWSAVVEPYVYTASAICVSPVKMIAFKGADLLALFELDSRLCCLMMRRICQVVANRLTATRLQLVNLFVVH